MPAACAAEYTAVALRGTYLCRDLINTPAADMGPAELEAVSRSLASTFGATVSTQSPRNLPIYLPCISLYLPVSPRYLHYISQVSTVEGRALREGYPQVHAVGRGPGPIP